MSQYVNPAQAQGLAREERTACVCVEAAQPGVYNLLSGVAQ